MQPIVRSDKVGNHNYKKRGVDQEKKVSKLITHTISQHRMLID